MPAGPTRRSFLVTATAAGVAVTLPRLGRASAEAPTDLAAPLTVDASASPPAPVIGQLRMGTADAGVAPSGETLAINSQYLVRGGRPWLPTAGEFHYSRYPADLWETALRAMRAAGTQIVSSYVIWIHHQELQDELSFSGRLDIARFLQLCADAGMNAVVRLGPWVHAEVRNGGIPDWVEEQSRVRTNDPAYLNLVTAFWTRLADQIRPLLWKAGGPIIGIQLENEFKGSASHIAALKSIASSLGLDVPLYTATAWDRATYTPLEEVPMFGGYQDLPWDTITHDEPPSECYSFRFFSRESGAYGYPDNSTIRNSQSSLSGTYPYLTAEYGGGTAPMYRRRVALNLPDDIAATMPVQLGSGVNLYGWYMLHGGRNPLGKTEPLQESVAEGSYNDLPVVNYDYQAPFGQNGEQRSSLGRIKLVHYFLEQFGADLATTSFRQPDAIASGAGDLSTLRWSVRSDGNRGYLFVNNYVRQYPMSDHPGTRFSVRFADETITLPSAGADIANGAYFIWPLNLDLDGARLTYATAQPVTSVTSRREPVYVFVAQDGIPAEFAFASETVRTVVAPHAQVSTGTSGRTLVTGISPSLDTAITVITASGRRLSILVLDQADADQLWRIELDNIPVLLLTEQEVSTTPNGFRLTSAGAPGFSFATLPAVRAQAPAGQLHADGRIGRFSKYIADVTSHQISVRAIPTTAPGVAPPVQLGGGSGGAVEPSDAVIEDVAGRWDLDVPWLQLADHDDALLTIHYAGDLARLYSGDRLIDDHFYNGQPWTVSLKQLAAHADADQPLTLAVMPLRADAPIYIQSEMKPTYDINGQACTVTAVTATPVYQLPIAATALPES